MSARYCDSIFLFIKCCLGINFFSFILLQKKKSYFVSEVDTFDENEMEWQKLS